jgi:hypothetical protein
VNRPDFQQTLRSLATEPLLQRVTASLPEAALAEIASDFAESDPYREAGFLQSALAYTGTSSSVNSVYLHQLWCAWREARWSCGALNGKPISLSITGQEWFEETAGHPTAVLMPMTLGLSDALAVLQQVSNSRPFVVYGEGMQESARPGSMAGLPFAGEGQTAVRKIRTVLAQNGLFCTYPDFVYSGHSTLPVRLFGISRPMSAGYVALIARPGTLVLPAIVLRDQDTFALHFHEPFQVPACPNAGWRSLFRQQLAEQCAQQLEALIRMDPAQWLLLNTLTFDSPQMGGH